MFCKKWNFLTIFEKTSCQEHACDVLANLAKWFKRCCFKTTVDDRQMHGHWTKAVHNSTSRILCVLGAQTFVLYYEILGGGKR